MKIKIVTLVAAMFATLAMSLALSASAASTPVAYMGRTWYSPQIRPAYIGVYMGNSVYVHTWHWSSWKSTYAFSRGMLHVDNCKPSCARGKFLYFPVGVTLSDVKAHGSTRYYYKMVLSYWARGTHHVDTFHYKGMWG